MIIFLVRDYRKRTDESIQVIETVAKKEVILLNPIYNGKAMAGLIDLWLWWIVWT